MENRISKIIEYWSIREPGLLSIYYTHKLEENNNMSCCFRIGRGLIEFNSLLLKDKREKELDEMLMTVTLRICLRHPYERQPYGCPSSCLIAASDMVLSPTYRTRHISLFHPADFQLPVGESFEWYASKLMDMTSEVDMEMKDLNSQISSTLQKIMLRMRECERQGNKDILPSTLQKMSSLLEMPDKNQGNSDSETSTFKQQLQDLMSDIENNMEAQDSETQSELQQLMGMLQEITENLEKLNSKYSSAMQKLMGMSHDEAATWQEDEEMRETIKERVENINSWGTVPTDIQELIKIAMEERIDYRKVLRAFSTSIISSERKFTRMRPNRRLGFKAMGSKHEMESRLLVAVDVSGSITNQSIGRFFRIITRFFKYGVDGVDVIQFDSEVKKQVLSLDKAAKNYTSFTRLGDGGTSFQSVMDYQNEHKGYDGVIIFTDGYAPVPDTYRLSRSKLLWFFDTEKNYNKNKEELSPTGRTCFIV